MLWAIGAAVVALGAVGTFSAVRGFAAVTYYLNSSLPRTSLEPNIYLIEILMSLLTVSISGLSVLLLAELWLILGRSDALPLYTVRRALDLAVWALRAYLIPGVAFAMFGVLQLALADKNSRELGLTRLFTGIFLIGLSISCQFLLSVLREGSFGWHLPRRHNR